LKLLEKKQLIQNPTILTNLNDLMLEDQNVSILTKIHEEITNCHKQYNFCQNPNHNIEKKKTTTAAVTTSATGEDC
jgi:hypothetical protein